MIKIIYSNIIKEADSDKLFIQALGCMKYIKGQSNHGINRIDITVHSKGVYMESLLQTESGKLYYNNDKQFVNKKDLPNFLARKIYK